MEWPAHPPLVGGGGVSASLSITDSSSKHFLLGRDTTRVSRWSSCDFPMDVDDIGDVSLSLGCGRG